MLFSILSNSGDIGSIILNLFTMVCAVLIAITAHEWAHGFVAYLNGDPTAKLAGRLSPNPLKHLDPIGFLMLIIAGFGWAKPVPVDSYNFKNHKRGLFTVAIAGVVMNLLLAILNAGFVAILYAIINATGMPTNSFLVILVNLFNSLFIYSIVINLTLMAFNILPIYPLDGFHIVETFTKYNNKFCVFMRQNGRMVLLGLIIVSSILGRFIVYLDIFGMYISFVTNGVMRLLSLVFGINI